MSDVRNPDDYCYRHPDRLSFVLCDRCGRTICLECQHHVDGQVFCPDDAVAPVIPIVSATRPKARRQRSRNRLRWQLPGWLEGRPVVTLSILALTLLIFLADIVAGYRIQPWLEVIPAGIPGYGGGSVLHQPWALVTSSLTSGGVYGFGLLSLVIGGYSIYVLGSQLEQIFGRLRFGLLYGLSGFGAAVFAFLLDGTVVSTFGAVMGLVAATVVVVRRFGGNRIFIYISCAVSFALAIILGGWQAALGGFVAGGAIALTYFFDGERSRLVRTRLILAAIIVVLLAIAVLRAVLIA